MIELNHAVRECAHNIDDTDGVCYGCWERIRDQITSLIGQLKKDPTPENDYMRSHLMVQINGLTYDALQLFERRRATNGWKRSTRRHTYDPDQEIKLAPGTRVLVYPEQGLGDTLMFSRFLRPLKDLVGDEGRVYFENRRALHPLFQCSNAPYDVMLHRGQGPVLDADYEIPLLSLPYVLSQAYNQELNFTRWHPYVTDPTKFPGIHGKDWRIPVREGCIRVGIVWQGNPTQQQDGSRSFPLAYLGSLAALEHVELFSLQKGVGEDQLRDVSWVYVFHGLDEQAAFMDTASILRNLDILVTADTSVAHLAGCMGVETWLVLSTLPDWRWGLRGNHSVWYGSVQTFRQPYPGNWPAVVERIRQQLERKETR